MKKIFTIIFMLLFAASSYAEFELNLKLGRIFDIKTSDAKTSNSDFHPGNVRASSDKDFDNGNLFSLGGSYFFEDMKYLGINAHIQRLKLDYPDFNAKLSDGSVGYSPGYTLKANNLHIGVILKSENALTSFKFKPYTAIDYVRSLSAEVDNTNRTPVYGVGGNSDVTLKGRSLRIGLLTAINKTLDLSIEYNHTDLDIEVDSFRSFNNGYDSDMQLQAVMIGFNFKF